LDRSIIVNIATAFIDDYAINKIENILKSNKKIKDFTLLIGLYGMFNQKKNLEKLISLANKFPRVLKVNVSKEHKFHLKYYYFKFSTSESCFIGSANFTEAGLSKNSELIVKITNNNSDKNKDKFVSASILEFQKELKNSISINQLIIDNYTEQKNLSNLPIKKGVFASLFPIEEELPETENTSLNAVIVILDSNISSKTAKSIEKQYPNWKDYFVLNFKNDYNTCLKIKSILLIEKKSRSVYNYNWITVTSGAIILTDDGKYFLSYINNTKANPINPEQRKFLEDEIFKLKLGSKKIKTKVLRHKTKEKVLSKLK
jgi:HKD family nuclease